MDRSMDSIGSCSLDVDAESSDISDTSGSLNFPTPISIKDITREFTNNIRERCSVQTVKNTTAFVDPVTGQVCIALTQAPTTTVNNKNISSGGVERHNQPKTNNNITTTPTSTCTPTLLSPQTPEDSYDKKPSYLNLACCVNGYSNITTYDSKIRQDINKSREVSPIRPSSSSLQYCKKSNSLAPPILLTMPNVNLTSPQQHQSPHQMAGTTNGVFATTNAIGSKYSIIESNNHNSQNGIDIHNNSNNEFGEGGGSSSGGVGGIAKRSFIQQRVERLYGPGALAQGFYSPKKTKDSSSRINKSDVIENGGGESAASELARKFQELSPSKDYNQFRKKLSNGKPSVSPNNIAAKDDTLKLDNNNIDLPCLRHLSQEFRAQLPVISPKRNLARTSPGRDTIQPQTHNTAITNGNNNTPPTTTTIETTTTATTPTCGRQFEQKQQLENSHHQITTILNSSSSIAGHDELDHKVAIAVQDGDISVLQNLVPPIDEPKVVLPIINPQKSISNISATDADENKPQSPSTTNGSVKPVTKDAHFFLKQLKDEQNRLLIMAVEIEKYLDALANNPDITEDILGLLRSASGKARLLVSQKMKQFEGLCHNNLNSSPADQFPTTVDDLQGFWDMVYLQVDHIDSIFAEIENLKKNDWKKPLEVKPVASFLRTPRSSKTALFIKPKQSPSITNGAAVMASPSSAALKREAQRKQLQEMKRRNREAMAAASTSSILSTESAHIDIVGVINVNSETNATTDNQQMR